MCTKDQHLENRQNGKTTTVIMRIEESDNHRLEGSCHKKAPTVEKSVSKPHNVVWGGARIRIGRVSQIPADRGGRATKSPRVKEGERGSR